MHLVDLPNKSPFATGFAMVVLPLRILLTGMSGIGLLFWSYWVLFLILYYGPAVLKSWALPLALFGGTYLLLSIYFCLKPPSLEIFAVTGAILNLPLVIFFIYSLSQITDYLSPKALIPVAYVVVWAFLVITRWFLEHQVPLLRQFISITVVVGLLLFGGTRVWPLMIDHESEVMRHLQAAHSNPADARAHLAEALQHATLLRNEYARSNYLGQIAMAHARLRLYDDANKIKDTYLNNAVHERDKERLATSIVMEQIKNRDYDDAMESARELNSAGRFQVQNLTLEAESRARQGNLEEARKILDLAIALANEQPREDTQRHAFIFIAEAQATIGWHEGALESTRKAKMEYPFALLGSIGVRESEAGFKESARDTLRVIHVELDNAVTKCDRRPNVEEQDDCLGKLVEELGDDRLLGLSGTVARRISLPHKREHAYQRISFYGIKLGPTDLEDLIKK